MNCDVNKLPETVFLDFYYYIFEVKVVSENRCMARAIVYTDPHITYIP
jgi:hypothetical protein